MAPRIALCPLESPKESFLPRMACCALLLYHVDVRTLDVMLHLPKKPTGIDWQLHRQVMFQG